MSPTPMQNDITLEEVQAKAFALLAIKKAAIAAGNPEPVHAHLAWQAALHAFCDAEKQALGGVNEDAGIAFGAHERAEQLLAL